MTINLYHVYYAHYPANFSLLSIAFCLVIPENIKSV